MPDFSQIVVISPRYFTRNGIAQQLEESGFNVTTIDKIEKLKSDIRLAGQKTLAIVEVADLGMDSTKIIRECWNRNDVRFFFLVDENNCSDLLRMKFEGTLAVISHNIEIHNFNLLIQIIQAGYLILPQLEAQSAIANETNVERKELDPMLNAAKERVHLLSAREREVVSLLGRGHGNKKLGSMLEISDTTVRLHIRSIMRKLGVENRTQVALMSALYESAAE
ncbi:LuxR C-terminal-related transcriptional regulator [Fulvimarina sp. 2208YS6-2-32]|uniref:LuxR C-terminal-related transcriptional regulator n=1 Tax=Fulvimarina uroteuthidis TaxID=3098149 RepID=A0ABU5I0Q8_9HYPH|nr:LuxR C-terminal-related transcriptional regulator [Fulvimarina sp. 2208YS6-2-32]MDY8108964.1 LuxR C-terminal-related transcriptional regulator [Fulvimarina sp. 2208YS6-2-32]